MKHIKIRSTLLKDTGQVEVTIVEQTHIHGDFGMPHTNAMFGNRIFPLGKWALYAPQGHDPKVYPGDGFFNGTLFLVAEEVVTGAENAPPAFTCTLAEYAQLKELVVAYNKWGADK